MVRSQIHFVSHSFPCVKKKLEIYETNKLLGKIKIKTIAYCLMQESKHSSSTRVFLVGCSPLETKQKTDHEETTLRQGWKIKQPYHTIDCWHCGLRKGNKTFLSHYLQLVWWKWLITIVTTPLDILMFPRVSIHSTLPDKGSIINYTRQHIESLTDSWKKKHTRWITTHLNRHTTSRKPYNETKFDKMSSHSWNLPHSKTSNRCKNACLCQQSNNCSVVLYRLSRVYKVLQWNKVR